jgi:hypothetical protein
MQRIGRLNPTKTILLLCDMQEKFARSIQFFNEIVETSARVHETCKLAKVPCLITEHYPKGFFIFSIFYKFYIEII